MKLFLSWSGERSHKVAELIGEWISGVIQQIEPWISSEMDRGAIFFPEIGKALDSVNNGIVCLTRENLTAPWILFEAGSLARNFGSNRVCTFLIDLQPSDVSDPLAQFNHTFPVKDSMFQLAKTLNERLGESKLSDVRLQKEFDLHWDLFESGFQKIMAETCEGEKPPQKSEKEILFDLADSVQRLERKMQTVFEVCSSHFDGVPVSAHSIEVLPLFGGHYAPYNAAVRTRVYTQTGLENSNEDLPKSIKIG